MSKKGLAAGTRKTHPVPEFNFSEWDFGDRGLFDEAVETFAHTIREHLENSITNPIARTLIEELQEELSTVWLDVENGEPVFNIYLAWGENGEVINIMTINWLDEMEAFCSDAELKDCPDLPARLRALADMMEKQ